MEGRRTDQFILFGSLLVCLLLLLPMSQPRVRAQEFMPTDSQTPVANDLGPQFGIWPTGGGEGDFFELNIDAGDSTRLTVILANADDEVLRLRTYVADVVPVNNGGFAISREDAPVRSTATWIDYSMEVYDIGPGEGIERTFSVTVPDNAKPGQYVAGIALQTADPLEVEGTEMFTQTIRKVVQVAITVPGPVEASFSLGEFEYTSESGVGVLTLLVTNTGNVLVKPEGELSILDRDGQTVFSSPVNMGSIYNGLSSPLVVAASEPLPSGDYQLTLVLHDEASGATASIEAQRISITNDSRAPSEFALDSNVSFQPDEAEPVYAEVAVHVTNNGEAVNSYEVVLDVERDGELVESFTIASSLALPTGDTEVAQRYMPPSGFESGEWTFVIRLNVVDPSTGASTTVETLDDIPTIVVP